MINNMDKFGLGLCLFDENKEIIKTITLSTNWTLNYDVGFNDEKMRKEVINVLKSQIKIDLDHYNALEKLLFEEGE